MHYEPYVGVRLLPAGERLAGLVIRRHRLVELFLVRVMGMSWDEVHDEAEKLEHVVSERLIERMDEMLGHPEVDPHGDPDSQRRRRRHAARAAQPADLPAGRAADGHARGRSGRGVSALPRAEPPEAGTGAARRVARRGGRQRARALQGREPLTIGARAASKLLVEVLSVGDVRAGAGDAGARAAAASPAPGGAPEPFAITDNSFFVEEAFNQEAARLPEHRRRPARRRQRRWGIDVHAGMAGAVDEAPALVHGDACQRRRRDRARATRC